MTIDLINRLQLENKQLKEVIGQLGDENYVLLKRFYIANTLLWAQIILYWLLFIIFIVTKGY
jgi:hypothetical protein